MLKTVLAFLILLSSMFLVIKILDLIFALFNIVLVQDKIQNRSKREQIVEAVINSFTGASFSDSQINAVNSCEIEVGIVCTEVAANVEGLEAGISAAVESAGDCVISALESFSN